MPKKLPDQLPYDEQAEIWQHRLNLDALKRQRYEEIEQNYIKGQAEINASVIRYEGTCRCGQHLAMRFYDGEKPISSEPMCPNQVFTRQLRRAIRDGRSEFANTYSDFMRQFARASGGLSGQGG